MTLDNREERITCAHIQNNHTYASTSCAGAASEMHFERPSVYRGISGDDCCCAAVSSSKYAVILEIHTAAAARDRERCFARLLCEPHFKVSCCICNHAFVKSSIIMRGVKRTLTKRAFANLAYLRIEITRLHILLRKCYFTF